MFETASLSKMVVFFLLLVDELLFFLPSRLSFWLEPEPLPRYEAFVREPESNLVFSSASPSSVTGSKLLCTDVPRFVEGPSFEEKGFEYCGRDDVGPSYVGWPNAFICKADALRGFIEVCSLQSGQLLVLAFV